MKPLTAAGLGFAGAALVATAAAGAFLWSSKQPVALAAGTTSPAPFTAVAPPLVSAEAIAQFTPEQREAIGAIIREYLLTNPELLEEVVAELERRRNAETAAQQAEALVAQRDTLLNSDKQVILGNPEGDVTLVEFFDYNCGYCRAAHGDLMRLIEEDGNLRVVLKEYPVLGQGSVEAAQVAIALNEVAPDRYLEFHDTMFTEPGQATGNRALAVADEMGIDPLAIRAAMESPNVEETIQEVYSLAEALSITGTPTYVVGNEVVVGAVGYDSLVNKIEQVRACGATVC
jgi:protein-disulfide isomerase